MLVLTLIIFVLVVFPPIMYVIEIVTSGSAYKHLLLLLPFQSDNDFFFHPINIKHIIFVTLITIKSHY